MERKRKKKASAKREPEKKREETGERTGFSTGEPTGNFFAGCRAPKKKSARSVGRGKLEVKLHLRVATSTAVKRLGQFFVLLRDISFTVKWKHEQGYI